MSFAAKQRQRLCSPDTISQIHHPRLSRATPPAQARIVRPAPGAGETSPQVRAPPARTPAETLTSGELFTVRLYGCVRLRRAPRQRRASPAGAATRSGRASARTSGVTPTTDDVGLLLSQTEIHFSRRETSIMVIAVIHCSFPVPAGCHRARAPRPVWGDQERDPCPPTACERDVRAPRRCRDASCCGAPGTCQNDRGLPWQAGILIDQDLI